MKRVVVTLLVLALVAGVGYYAFSRYLVSRLDGAGGVVAPRSDLVVFESDHIGISFKYPNIYEATTTHAGNAERDWHAVVLLPKGYMPPQGGEGPPAITLQDIPNPESLGLEAWVKGDARSNYKLSGDGAMTAGQIDGAEAIFYAHSGLYEFDAAAVAHDGKVFLFEVSYDTQHNPIRSDFQNLLKTVQFTDAR